MGLALPALRFLLREHKKQPFTGPVLTLGRQCVYATYPELQRLFKQENIRPRPLPTGLSVATNIPRWKESVFARNTSDVVFFTMLGLEVKTLDNTDYEGAEYLWDLNKPVPLDWHGKFKTIIDSGTIEHVFDVRQVFRNLVNLLAEKGNIIHLTPANNYLEHGFYQLSPTVFYDYYASNGFTDLTGCLAEQPPWAITGKTWRWWQWNPERQYARMRSRHLLATVFTAQKTIHSTDDRIPEQGFFANQADGGRTGSMKTNEYIDFIYKHMPSYLIDVGNRLLQRDKTVKPWGLKYLGKR